MSEENVSKEAVSEEVVVQTAPESIRDEIKPVESSGLADLAADKSVGEVLSEEIKFNTAHSSPATVSNQKNLLIDDSDKIDPLINDLTVLGFTKPSNAFMHWLWEKALIAKRARQRKKLERIMDLFTKKSEITNDMVEKLLHISDTTATRYLKILEQENKIKKNIRGGGFASYSKI